MEQLNTMGVIKNQAKNGTKTRKEFADIATRTINKSIMFDYLTDKFEKHNIKEYIANKYQLEKILDWIK